MYLFTPLKSSAPQKDCIIIQICENSKMASALNENIRIAHVLSHGHLGHEGCCSPSLKCVQWLHLM